jgi:glycosyltransferase involved in cell wall biosynthesis
MPPMVSVVIPTFNRSSRVINAIESVLRQTYTNFEILVVDDGSTDDTREKLKPYVGRTKYVHQENRGASAAQNKGVSLATGEWISILGDDDDWLPTKLECQFEALAKCGEECGACFTNCQFIVNGVLQQTIFAEAGFKNHQRIGILDDWFGPQVERYPIIWAQSLMVRRSLFNELGGFDGKMTINEDLDLIFRLALKTRICFVSDPLVRIDRTLSETRLTGLVDFWNDAQFSSRAYMYAKWLALSGLEPEVRTRISRIRRELLYDWMMRKVRQAQFFDAVEKAAYLREIGETRPLILHTLLMRGRRKIIRLLKREPRTT